MTARAVLLALLLAGCALPAQPLARVDVTGRDPKTVEADKLACWQQAERAHPSWGAAFFTPLLVAREAHAPEIERDAEACLVARG